MKHTVSTTRVSALLATGVSLMLPVSAANPNCANALGMGEKGKPDGRLVAGMLRDMLHKLNEISDTMDKENINPDTMKKVTRQLKQFSATLENISGIVDKDAMMNTDQRKKMPVDLRSKLTHLR